MTTRIRIQVFAVAVAIVLVPLVAYAVTTYLGGGWSARPEPAPAGEPWLPIDDLLYGGDE